MKKDSSFFPEEEFDGSGGDSLSLPFLSSGDNIIGGDIVVHDAENERIDLYLSRVLGFSRNFVQNLLRNGNVRVNGTNVVKQSARVFAEMKISVTIPPPRSSDITPEDVPFDVLFEDDHLLVIAKPSGVVVHPAPGNWTGTLVHGLLHRYPDIGNIGNVLRPGIVHWLDGATSGLLVVARSQTALVQLQEQFKARSVEKEYLAVVHGTPERQSGTIDLPIGRDPVHRICMAVTNDGKPSRTQFRVLWNRGKISLLRVAIHSGRTHQIRVHMKTIGHPVVGDELYCSETLLRKKHTRLLLHAWRLSFEHPATKERMSFLRPLPEDFIADLQELLSSKGDS